MSDGATGNSVAARSHGFSPWRLAHSATQEALLAALQRTPVPPECSVGLKRNSKGVVEIEVVARAVHIERAENEASLIFNMLSERYPYPNGDTAP